MPPPSQPEAGPSNPQARTARPLRPLCRYIAMPGGCFAGSNCKFRHGEEATQTPHQEAQTCRFFAAGFCKRGEDCWYKHVGEAQAAPQEPNGEGPDASLEAGPSSQPGPAAERPEVAEEEEEEHTCMICYEKPAQFALLVGCSHIFCLTCMRGWRDSKDKEISMLESGVIKACPVCRVPSRFITPSSQFFPEGHPKKTAMIEAYKASMGRVPCRYFARSVAVASARPFCPYGRDCFYEHKLPNGELYLFPHGAEHYMTIHRERLSQRRRDDVARSVEALADIMFSAGLEGGEGARAELERDGFFSDFFNAMEWGQGLGAVNPGAALRNGTAREQMLAIRGILSEVARDVRDPPRNLPYDDEDEDLPPLIPAPPNAAARAAATQPRTRTHFGPRAPSPHPRAAQPATDGDSDEIPALLSMSESESESEDDESSVGEDQAAGTNSASRRRTQTGAAQGRGTHAGNNYDDLPPLEDASDSDEEGQWTTSEDEAAPAPRTRGRRPTARGPVPAGRPFPLPTALLRGGRNGGGPSRATAVQPWRQARPAEDDAADEMPPLLSGSESEEEDEDESSEGDGDDEDDEGPPPLVPFTRTDGADGPAFPASPAQPVPSLQPVEPSLPTRAGGDALDGGLMRVGLTSMASPSQAPAGSAAHSIVANLARTVEAMSTPSQGPPVAMRTSTDSRPGTPPAVSQEQEQQDAAPTAGSSRASRFLATLFRRDGNDRRAG